MINAFELITDIVQVIQARPNKANNSFYKALNDRDGINGKIPLVRISNHKTHCQTWLQDIKDLGTAMRFPANYFISIVIEDKPSSKNEQVTIKTKPFVVYEYTYKEEDLEQTDIHALIQAVKAIFTTGVFVDPIGKAHSDIVTSNFNGDLQESYETGCQIYMPKQNEVVTSHSILLTESAFSDIINECVRQVLTELTPYKPVAHNKTITLDNGVKTKSLVTLSNGIGGKYEIYEDDGCYAIWHRGWKGKNNHWHIFPELHDALKKLPTLPLH